MPWPDDTSRQFGQAPRLRGYLKDLWDYRELVQVLAIHEFQNRHRGMLLGAGWNLLTPLLLLGTYWIVFGVVLAGRRPENFLAFLAVGIFLFRFIQRSVQDATTSLTKDKRLIRSIHFPRAVLPIADVIRNAIAFLWEIPIVILIVVLTTGDLKRGWLVFLLAVVPLTAFFSAGLALTFARIGSVLLDVKHIVPLVFRILFYLSGILFPVRAFLDAHPLLGYLPLNPVYAFVALARNYILAPEEQLGLLWGSALAWTVFLAVFGIVFFSRADYRYSRG